MTIGTLIKGWHFVMTLNDLKPNQCCIIDFVMCGDDIKRRLLDLGLIPGTKVTYIRESPSGDPVSFLIRETNIALRKSDLKEIYIKEIKESKL